MIPIAKSSSKVVNNHYDLIKDSLKKRIANVVKNGAVVGSKPKKTASRSDRVFLRNLMKEDSLKELITCPPEKLYDLVKKYQKSAPNILDTTDNLNRLLYGIFINTEYTKKLDKWKFIQRINIDTCPYCNRNYIYSLTKKSKIKPEIDHYYPKSKYPFFGLSFYNLIPSCQTCNGFGAKEEKDPKSHKMLSPYLIDIKDFKFTFDLKHIDLISPLEGKSAVNVKLKKKISGNNNVFKLSKLYRKHEDHALELIVKSELEYSDGYREYLNGFKGLNFSKAEIDRLLIGNYTDPRELHKRPLSKLYRDIAIELGLIVE